MPENKKFWKFCNQAGNKVELLLYGDISQTSWWGDEVTPKQFAEELAGLGALDKITVRINSGGGDVFAAQAIGNQLEQHPAAVTAKIDGLCASAATIVACHCGKVIAANMWGKVKTVLQMLTIIFYYFTVSLTGNVLGQQCADVASVLCWVVAAVTAISGIKYLWDNRSFINTAK